MRLFTRLYLELDATTRTTQKVAAMRDYFLAAPPADAVWGFYFLSGRRLKRRLSTPVLRAAAAQASGTPPWMIDQCQHAVGDLAETLALLLGADEGEGADLPLHAVVDRYLMPLPHMEEPERVERVREAWEIFSRDQTLVYHKLLLGAFRVGASGKLVERALAEAIDQPPAVVAHRLSGKWKPTAEDFARIVEGEADREPGQPYPFCLAHPLKPAPDTLGDVGDWLVEPKWDGIRSQLIHRNGCVALWSRGEELITDSFPELRQLGEALPDRTVLDGEVLAWEDGRPLPFAVLQKRLGRKNVQPRLFAERPIVFMAYDLLEFDGEDWRNRPITDRRAQLRRVLEALDPELTFVLSEPLEADDWPGVVRYVEQAREHGTEGVMLKRKSSTYGVGRQRGDWWKLKADPFSIDAVLIAAQPGHGKRASLYTDYTFGLWDQGQLVPVAKAYSGLTDVEIAQVDRFVREHTTEKHGPVRYVEHELVFELHFEAIQQSTRHRSGLAVRFPRIARWRHDKKPADADTLDTLQAMMPA